MTTLAKASFNSCLKMLFACCIAAFTSSLAPALAQSSQDPVYIFHTNLGDMNVQLFPDVTPKTVANFLAYVNAGAYNGTIFHRSAPGFVIQGGGFDFKNNGIAAIPANAPVVNEYHLSNVRGTIAMAKLGSGPDTATNQWFFNELDSNAANLDGQNGGFTVFGRIIDMESLAVMDRIAAVPNYDASTYYSNSALNQLPIINLTGQTVAENQLVTVSSIKKMPNWGAMSISVGADGSTRVLWNQPSGAASFWTISATGGINYGAVYAPYSGWRAEKVIATANGGTDIFWTNINGSASYWRVSATGSITYSPAFGPYTGWSPADFSTASDGTIRLLWTNSNGSASYWSIGSNGGIQYSPIYAPNPGWTATYVSAASSGVTRMLWINVNGAASYWTIDASGGAIYSPVYGPYNGWRCAGIGLGGDGNTRLQWNSGDATSFWTISSSGGVSYSPVWGPYAGWSPISFAVAPDNSVRLLWGQANGAASYWAVGPNGSIAYSPIFGPY